MLSFAYVFGITYLRKVRVAQATAVRERFEAPTHGIRRRESANQLAPTTKKAGNSVQKASHPAAKPDIGPMRRVRVRAEPDEQAAPAGE